MPTWSLNKLKLDPSSANSPRMLLPRLGIPPSSSSQNYACVLNSPEALECHLGNTPICSLLHVSYSSPLLSHTQTHAAHFILLLNSEAVLSETTLRAAADGRHYSFMTFPNSWP